MNHDISTNYKYQQAVLSNASMNQVSFQTVSGLKVIAQKDWCPSIFLNGNRKNEFFIKSDFLYGDIDNDDRGDKISMVEFQEKFSEYEFYIITSRSHRIAKKDNIAADRFHVLFPQAEPIFSQTELKLKLVQMIKDNAFFDKSCNDPARFFFGFDNCEVIHNDGKPFTVSVDSGKDLDFKNDDDEIFKELIADSRTGLEDFDSKQYKTDILDKKSDVLRLLRIASNRGDFDEYSNWLKLGMGLYNDGYSLSDWLDLSSPDSATDCANKWEGLTSKVSGGSLIHICRTVEPNFLKKGSLTPSRKLEIAIEKKKEAIENNTETQGLSSPFGMDQFSNAARVIYYHGDDLKFVSDSGNWSIWNKNVWVPDLFGRIKEVVKTVLEEVAVNESKFYELPETDNKDDLKKAEKRLERFLQFCQSIKTSSQINGVVEILSTSCKNNIPISETSFDSDPFIFNCKNGILDLKTGELMAHDKFRLCSKISNVEYTKDAKCDKFVSFLRKIMKGNTEVIEWMQMYFGYCLTGLPPNRMVAFFWGDGRNGKSTLVNIVSRIIGEYSVAARIETFIESNNADKINQDIVQFRGSRLITAQESSDGQRLNENRIKDMSGGDKIVGRYLYSKQDISFVNTGKMIFSTNHKPKINGTDKGMWDRIRLIPFEYHIKDDELVDRFDEMLLKEESEGIFNWIYEGLRKLMSRNFKFPVVSTIEDATQEYKDEEDRVGQFLSDRCVFAFGHSLSSADLYREYSIYCGESGIKGVMTSTRFGRDLVQRTGLERIKSNRSKNQFTVKGIRWRNESDLPEELGLEKETKYNPAEMPKELEDFGIF